MGGEGREDHGRVGGRSMGGEGRGEEYEFQSMFQHCIIVSDMTSYICITEQIHQGVTNSS